MSEIIDDHHYDGSFSDQRELGMSEFTSKGQLIVKSQLVEGDNSDLQLKVEFKALKSQKILRYFGKDRPFLIIKWKLKKEISEDDSFVKVFESSYIDDTLSPIFRLP